MPFFFKKKCIIAAHSLCYEAQIYYDMALQSDSIFLFLDNWNAMKSRIAELRTYEKRIPIEIYNELSLIELKENEFQWKLKDAIERAQNSAIRDLKNEYRNNKQNRYTLFINDINRGKPYYSKDTSDFANSVISSVAAAADIVFCVNGNKDSGTLIQDIDNMDGAQFELWSKNFLLEIGFEDVSLTGKSGDQGVDLLAYKDGIKYAIQCKCYSSDLGNTPIQEVNTGKVIYNCHVGAVLTNRHFTPGGKEAAKATGVLLWDRDWIQDKLSLSAVSNIGGAETSLTSLQNTNDSLYQEAVNAVLESKCASVNFLQRKFNIGYARAARLIDEMEQNGIVGPFRGSRPREILFSRRE